MQETELSLPVSRRDHVQGPVTAPVTLVEYGDYQCPQCAASYREVKRLQEEMGDRMCLVYRHFPNSPLHDSAVFAAELAEAAARQRKFWALHDLLFENHLYLGPQNIMILAMEIGVDLERAKWDIENGDVVRHLREDMESAVRSGVRHTPSFFINGVLHRGEPTFDALRDAVLVLQT